MLENWKCNEFQKSFVKYFNSKKFKWEIKQKF